MVFTFLLVSLSSIWFSQFARGGGLEKMFPYAILFLNIFPYFAYIKYWKCLYIENAYYAHLYIHWLFDWLMNWLVDLKSTHSGKVQESEQMQQLWLLLWILLNLNCFVGIYIYNFSYKYICTWGKTNILF